MTIPSECGNFKVISLKLKDSLLSEHFIFVREHSVREKCVEKPNDKTIFILGVPPFVTENMFTDMFSQFGMVKSVFFHSAPDPGTPSQNISKFFNDFPVIKGYKCGYVVFDKSSSIDKVMSMEPDEKLLLLAEENSNLFGLNKWCDEYNKHLINPEEIQKEIDDYMQEYDKKVEDQETRLKAVTEPDEDGWITVTKKSRKPIVKRKESVQKNIARKESVKSKKKQLLNFYRFQIRESKMNQLVKLREKYEEDKKKIELMKQSRKFKPF